MVLCTGYDGMFFVGKDMLYHFVPRVVALEAELFVFN